MQQIIEHGEYARFLMLFVVYRRGLIGFPYVSGAMIRSSASAIPGCETVIGFLTPSTARILVLFASWHGSASERALNSLTPAEIVFLCTPDMALTSLMPPRPIEIASDARYFLNWLSFKYWILVFILIAVDSVINKV